MYNKIILIFPVFKSFLPLLLLSYGDSKMCVVSFVDDGIYLSIPTFAMVVPFAAFQLLSLGILPFGASRTITAAVTLTTAAGGEPNDLSSVRLP